MADTGLPAGLAAPARRALAGAGVTTLEQVARLRESDLRAMHGMGPKTVDELREALAANGMSFEPEGSRRQSAEDGGAR